MKNDYNYECLKNAIADTVFEAIYKHLPPMLVKWGYPKRLFRVRIRYISKWCSKITCTIKTPKGNKHYEVVVREARKQ